MLCLSNILPGWIQYYQSNALPFKYAPRVNSVSSVQCSAFQIYSQDEFNIISPMLCLSNILPGWIQYYQSNALPFKYTPRMNSIISVQCSAFQIYSQGELNIISPMLCLSNMLPGWIKYYQSTALPFKYTPRMNKILSVHCSAFQIYSQGELNIISPMLCLSNILPGWIQYYQSNALPLNYAPGVN